MIDFRLVRHFADDQRTLGYLYDSQGRRVCCTIERPWVDVDADGGRDRGKSRFVPGVYRCEKAMSPSRGYPVWWVRGVPDAENIQIHIANLPNELEGCVGIGEAFGIVNGQRGVVRSKVAFDAFMALTRDRIVFLLEVVDHFAEAAA